VARKSKIVATLGPASSSEEMLGLLIEDGVDIFRLNFSHGSHAEHGATIERIRKIAEQKAPSTAIMADLQGPKIRIGRFAEGTVELVKGREFIITTEDVPGDEQAVSTDYPGLPNDVEPGSRLLMADGLLQFEVKKVDGPRVVCEVIEGGTLSDRKGINLPGVKISLPTLTDKDRKDLAFALQHKVDAIAISFVRNADDITLVRKLVDEANSRAIIIAKIEKPEALDEIKQIIERADGIMIARGDLGVEIPPEKVPFVQKNLVSEASRQGKIVIIATQMLESMTSHLRPTRAEVSDVANAVFDGTDAVMLSGETSIGKYPRETVRMMARIVSDAEGHLQGDDTPELDVKASGTIAAALSSAVDYLASHLKLAAVVSFTLSGSTAGVLSKTRPLAPIYSFCRWPDTARRLNFLYGVHTRLIEYVATVEEFETLAEKLLLEDKLITNGDLTLTVAGSPLASRGKTNLLKLNEVGTKNK
jgi:pyruvate kinase